MAVTDVYKRQGRYRGKAGALASYFSEFALIKYRVQVEIEYFITPVSYTHLGQRIILKSGLVPATAAVRIVDVKEE